MLGYKKLICILSMAYLSFAGNNMTIDLKWLPSIDFDGIENVGGLSTILNHNYSIEVIDKRIYKDEIGRNEEDKDVGLIKKVFTKSNVPDFVKTNTIKCLSNYGLKISGKESSDFTIQIEILDYYVLEESIYRGILKTNITLLDKEGKGIIKTLTVGESKPWGRSFSKENYLNTLSNCIIDNTKAILNNTYLINAISGMN